MIVVDENIHDQRILAAIRSWSRGRVISITQLRPGSIILDDAIPALLVRANRPTFVTINVDDFWRRVRAHPRYCIVNVESPKERSLEVPRLLRRLLRTSGFSTKATRMGKVVRLLPSHFEYYAVSGSVQRAAWQDGG